jgi:Ca-activated chloride channel homolog
MNLRYPALLLLALPLAAWFVLILKKNGGIGASPIERLRAKGRSLRSLLWWLPEALAFASALACVFLLAGPQRRLDTGSEEGRGVPIAIAIDRSSSMSALVPFEGAQISRLEGVKKVTADFLKRRPRDAFALLSFARYPETHAPLTTSRDVLLGFLSLIDIPRNRDEDGTAIGDALVLAVARLSKPGEDRKGVVILLTDGRNNCGEKSPDEAAAIAAKAGVTVYPIALGGQGVYVQDGQAMDAPVDIDERTLASIARASSGRYFRADGISDLGAFYDEIATRETAKIERAKPQETELRLASGLALLLALALASALARHAFLKRGDL